MPVLAHLFVRSPQGRIAAFSPTAELPAPLKTLLKAVDGKTATDALAAAHAGLGDVASLLAILRDNGLIADKNAAGAPARATPVDNHPWANSDHPLLESSFGDLGASVFGQFPSPKPTKSE